MVDSEISDEAPPMIPAMPDRHVVGVADEAVLAGVAQAAARARPGCG